LFFALQSGLSTGEAVKAFHGYDSNNDGVITASDFLVTGNAAQPDGLSTTSVVLITMAALVAGIAVVASVSLYLRSKKRARGFQALSEARTNGLFDEEEEVTSSL